MDSSGIEVRLDELGRQVVLGGTKSQIIQKLADAYAETPEYKNLLESIRIDRSELRELVINKMADEIIRNWIREAGQ